ncbi:RIP metalloprotease RseP [Sphingomicrobium astaxanthinifaciens]|uniref:RIP metalloprotease RseP n=1 Tax=Sphingomicrobium astaxanthinifaciens TaxID=1227949 RepID=UPI001FCCBF84|nr:RIP metalloprotease RseP [Sphingomicrobium astaxanthinifaciens]MCJ7420221.1 RIP metalloprotease RseP [Sphingomicrobium astaxanthinifaciens]
MMEQPSLLFILVAFVAVLGPLVFFHELGHYGVARLFGIKAEAFSIGFGREIVGWNDRRGTRWKVGWLPLGGYVKFAGDADAASRPERGDTDPDHFHNRPVWQRFLVVLAGPMANFLIAILIFAAFFATIGTLQPAPAVVGGVEPDTPAASVGLEEGDRILSIDGRETVDFNAITRTVILRPGAEVPIAFERDGAVFERTVRLDAHIETDAYGQEHEIGRLGITQALGERRTMGPLAALVLGAERVWVLLGWMVDGLGQIIFGTLSVEQLGGPIKMAQVSGQQAALGWEAAVGLAALISINLGFINLLPIPMLDGGHLLFYAIEAIRRRPVSDAAQEWAFRGGLALLAAFFLFVTLNDLASIGLVERIGRLIG